jgi:hypothetical protein
MTVSGQPTTRHRLTGYLAFAAKMLALTAIAVGVGVAITIGSAVLGHAFLVMTVGEEGIPAIDDTPLMRALVASSYLAGVASVVLVLAAGLRRSVHGPR